MLRLIDICGMTPHDSCAAKFWHYYDHLLRASHLPPNTDMCLFRVSALLPLSTTPASCASALAYSRPCPLTPLPSLNAPPSRTGLPLRDWSAGLAPCSAGLLDCARRWQRHCTAFLAHCTPHSIRFLYILCATYPCPLAPTPTRTHGLSKTMLRTAAEV